MCFFFLSGLQIDGRYFFFTVQGHVIFWRLYGNSFFESMDEEEVASASTFSTLLLCKKSRKGENTLKTVSSEEPQGTPDPSSPSGPNKNTRRIWKHEDIEEFQLPNSRFEPPEAVKTPFQYFRMLFTDHIIEHIAHHTNLYSAQVLGDRFYKICPIFEMLREQRLLIPST